MTTFSEIVDFEQHAMFYTKRKDLWPVFDKFFDAKEEKSIDSYSDKTETGTIDQIKSLINIFKKKGYSLLLKDITTPDVRQLGFYSEVI